MTLFAALVIFLVQIALLIGFRGQIIGAFTSVKETAEIVKSAWPVLCIFTLPDTVQAIGLSVIRGAGK